MASHQPIFNVPRSVMALIVLMTAVQAVRVMLPDEMDLTFLLTLAFIPARYSGDAAMLPGGYAACVTSFVTYMIVHGGWLHLFVNMLWMLAFGSAVARRIGGARFIYFSILAGIVGALTHLAFHFGEQAPVVGASAAISGQMAAAIRFVFQPGGLRFGANGRPDLVSAPLASLGQTLRDPRILLFLVIWVLLNVAFGLSAVDLSGTGAGGSVAWEAHIGGFLFGLLCFGFFDRQPEPMPARFYTD